MRRSATFAEKVHKAMPTPKASATTPHRGAGHALFLLKLSRPYFWLVTFWLYLLPTGRRFDLLSSGWFWCGFAYSTLPLNLLCYLMNDLADVAVDRDNPRKGGALLGIRAQLPALRSAVGWCSAVQVPFLLAFAYSFGAVRCALWFAGVFAVNWLYNFGPRLSSNYAPLDLICPCGYMLVIPLRRAASPALWPRCAAPPATASAPRHPAPPRACRLRRSCWLNHLPLPPGRAWAHTAFFVARTQLWIQTFDLETDARSGRRTTAVVLGVATAQVVLAALLSLEVTTPRRPRVLTRTRRPRTHALPDSHRLPLTARTRNLQPAPATHTPTRSSASCCGSTPIGRCALSRRRRSCCSRCSASCSGTWAPGRRRRPPRSTPRSRCSGSAATGCSCRSGGTARSTRRLAAGSDGGGSVARVASKTVRLPYGLLFDESFRSDLPNSRPPSPKSRIQPSQVPSHVRSTALYPIPQYPCTGCTPPLLENATPLRPEVAVPRLPGARA